MNNFSVYTPAAGPWISATELPKDIANYLLVDDYEINYIGFYSGGQWLKYDDGLELKNILYYAKIFNT